MAVAVGDQTGRGGGDFGERGDEGLDRHDRTPDVEGVGAFEWGFEGAEECCGNVADVLQVLQAAVADPVGTAGGDRLDRLGRLARHAEVAADAVDGPGAQADARDPAVEPVDLGVQLVADLERAVVSQGAEANFVGDRPCRPRLLRPVHRRRAGVDDAFDLPLQGDRRFEHGERADHVDLRPQDRVGPAGRGLQARQVEQVGRPNPHDGLVHGFELRDVPLHEVDAGLCSASSSRSSRCVSSFRS